MFIVVSTYTVTNLSNLDFRWAENLEINKMSQMHVKAKQYGSNYINAKPRESYGKVKKKFLQLFYLFFGSD